MLRRLQPGDVIFVRDEPEAWIYVEEDGYHHILAWSSNKGKQLKYSVGHAYVHRGIWTFAGPVRLDR